MTESKTYERIPRQQAADIATKSLRNAGYAESHVEVMARNMVEAQAQECHSMGSIA